LRESHNYNKSSLEYIKSRFGDDVKIEHCSTLDEVSVDYAFFVSNEIFDASLVHL